MTVLIQQSGTTVQPAPPATPRAINGDELSARINKAINDALSQGGTNAERRQSIREAMEEMKAEMQAARAQGQSITINPSFNPENVIPPQAVDISVAFFVMMGFIIVG